MYIKIGKFEMEMPWILAAGGMYLVAQVANNCLRVKNNKYRCEMVEILSRPVEDKESQK